MGLAGETGTAVPCPYKFGSVQNCVVRMAKFAAAMAMTLERHESRLSGWGGCGLFEAGAVTDGSGVVPIAGVVAGALEGVAWKT